MSYISGPMQHAQRLQQRPADAAESGRATAAHLRSHAHSTRNMRHTAPPCAIAHIHHEHLQLSQELQRELEARAVAAAAAGAELARLRARAEEADAGEAASAAVAKDGAALRRQLDEVMLSHEAAVQSRDRALAQVPRCCTCILPTC